MAGNIDIKYYKQIEGSDFFKLPSRYQVYEYFKKHPYYCDLSSYDDLNGFIKKSIDYKVIIINTISDFRIENAQLKSIYASFNYYLALPGIDMPQAHNLIEAISCGCIPIIHENYSNVLFPPLQHNHNAFTYRTLKELDAVIQRAFSLSKSEITQMRKNIVLYYKNHLCSSAVVRKIEKNNFNKIYILAEADSLALLK